MKASLPRCPHCGISVTVVPSPPLSFCFLFVFLLFISFQAVTLFAQADVSNSTLKGKIVDQAGASVRGAIVAVKAADRDVIRTAKTDEEGMYRAPLLPAGVYELRIEAQGFQSQVVTDVILTVGQIVVRDIQLQVGSLSEKLEVTDTPRLVETERTQQSDTIERRQIVGLPNLSRNFTSYVFTLPGVTDAAAARVQQTRVTSIATSGFSMGAGNGRSNYVSIDGGENDSGTGNLRIRNLSVEAVQEFQVNRNAYSAEYGFTAGTAINVVTRSGSNAFHGSAYLFYRSQDLAARDAFNTTGQKAFEQRISPGFTFEGPIVRKKAFFFTSFEALKYDVARLRSYTVNASLLSPTGAQSTYLQTLLSGPNSTDATRNIAGRLQAALIGSNYPTTMKVLTESEGQFTAPSRRYNWTNHLDYTRGERDLFSGRFTMAFEKNDLLRVDNVEAPSNGVIETADDYTGVGTWSHIFDEQLLNQFRVQFVYDDYQQISRAPATSQIVISGLLNYGRSGIVPFIIKQNRYQFEDTLNWSRGSIDLKFGASYRPVDALMITEIGFAGTFQFSAGLPLNRALSVADLAVLTGPLAPPADTILTSLQAFNLGIPSVWTQGFGNPGFQAWQHNFGTFVQTSWKAMPRLTLNLGARLDYNGEPEPMDCNIGISPRLGFAWDPFGKGETVIRGGFGTFYSPVGLQVVLAATLLDDNQFIISQSRGIADGTQSPQALWEFGTQLGKLPFLQLTETDVRAFGIIPTPGQPNRRETTAAENYDNPYTVQASLGVSQQLGHDFSLDVSVLMYHGVHLPIALEGNYRESGQFVNVPGMPGSDLFGPRLERIDPAIAQLVVHSSVGNSIYYAMTASALKRFGRGYQLRASYTYGKALDDVTDFNGGLTPFLPTRRYLDRGLSSFDIRHSFVFSSTFESPFKRGADRNWAQNAFAEITLSPIVTLRSGFPFNLFIGRDVNGDLNTTDRPLYSPRNSGIGENFYSVDLRLSKRFYLGSNAEGPRIELIAEASNIFNHVNYLRVNDIVCGTTVQPGFINGCDPKFLTGPFDFRGVAGRPPTAPLGFVSAAPPRQFQFGIKFEM